MSEILARNPWYERFPAFLRDVFVRPRKKDGTSRPRSRMLRKNTNYSEGVLFDAQGRVAPCETLDYEDQEAFWNFVAASSDRPITIFGEWDQNKLTLFSAWDHERALIIDGTPV